MNFMRFIFNRKSEFLTNDYRVSNNSMLNFVNKKYLDSKREKSRAKEIEA